MRKVFPCYSTADRELAHSLAAFLERGTGVEVLLEEGEMAPGADLIAKVEEGLASDIVLVLVSPDSVPARWILERWRPVFQDQAVEMGTELATLLCRDAKLPDLLRRKNFFDLRRNHLPAFRAVKRWLMSLAPPAQKAPFEPAVQPSFTGCEAELENLCITLADTPGRAVLDGPAGVGKTALALAFAERHLEEFDAVFWLGCGSRTAPALAGDLAAQLGVRLDRDLESNLAELRRLCAQYRCLLVLDDAAAPTAPLFVPHGRTSVLITTRRPDLAAPLSAAAIHLAEAPALDPAQLAETIRSLDNPQRRMLSGICACASTGLLLDMAARTADAEPAEARKIVALFVAKSIASPLDAHGPRYLVPAFTRERAALQGDAQRWSRHHARATADLFGAPQPAIPDLTPYWPDLQHAFTWSLTSDWLLACTLARRALAWAKSQERLAEAFQILQDWRQAAERCADRRVLEDCAWEQIWILEHWGRPAEARELDQLRREQFADQMPLLFD